MGRLRHLLFDAGVLLDFVKADRGIFSLASRHVGSVNVATPVFEGMKALDPSTAAALGIKLYEPPLDVVAASATASGRLSFLDRLCLAIAKTRGWSCVSNDTQLRAGCSAEAVTVLWGFDVLGLLVEARALTPVAARTLANNIVASNKRIGRPALVKFFRRIGVKE